MNIYSVTGKLNPTSPLIPLNLSKVFFIILHHAEAKSCTWEDINRWHKQNTWSCAGYGEFITKTGDVYILRGDHIGAQCLNMNSKSYGICVEGNYHVEKEMPEAQFKALVERLKYHKSRLPNKVEIAPHSRFFNTACPGQYFPMDKIIADANSIITPLSDAIEFIGNHAGIDKNYWLYQAGLVKYLDKAFIKIADAWRGGK